MITYISSSEELLYASELVSIKLTLTLLIIPNMTSTYFDKIDELYNIHITYEYISHIYNIDVFCHIDVDVCFYLCPPWRQIHDVHQENRTRLAPFLAPVWAPLKY